jgi:hypothetical protein
VVSGAFRARYAGGCAECWHDIEPGELVRFDDDDRLVHDSCAAEPELAEQPACPSCWLVHAGECM